MTFDNLMIGGRWRPATEGQTIPVFAPSTGQQISSIPRGGEADVGAAVKAAREAFEGAWGAMPAFERGRLLSRFAARILDHAEELALLEASDTGKPMTLARNDIKACARYFEFYGGAADKIHGETIPYLSGYQVIVLREARGVTGHIIPWNYPAQMFGRTLAPALAAGNATVLKPAEEACLSSFRLVDIAMDVGFPEGAINLVSGLGSEAGAALTAHPGLDLISFTGSPAVGTLVQQAAAMNHVPCVLELGGKSPQIVFDDADVESASKAITAGIIQNAGQTCSAGSRVLIHQKVYDQVLAALADRFSRVVAGPHELDLDCGPVISAKQQGRVENYLREGERDGVTVAAQGQLHPRTQDGGYFVTPTLFSNVASTHLLAQEEIFGPVLVALPFSDEADAIRIANDTPYDLMAGIWTRDGGRQLRLAKAVRAGQIYVNGFGAGGGIELPFGGFKRSGHGREKGFEALREFTVAKTVILNHG